MNRLRSTRTRQDRRVPYDPVKQQARERVRREVLLPILLVAALIFVVLPLALLGTMSAAGVATVANFMAAIFILIPLVLLCIVPYALLIAAIFGMTIVNRRVPRLLGGVRNTMYQVNAAAQSGSQTIAKPVIAVSRRLAWLERALGFEPPRAK
jgi:hypothetical protein